MQHKNATKRPLEAMPTLHVREHLQIKLAGIMVLVDN